ncbi:MAG: hypothetical protein LBS56_11065 [Propionibacteriaceae bacterium]|jgi:predicted transcriptional regulator|nr:hypothetical protein [Propionibacteriaceae bacterium]
MSHVLTIRSNDETDAALSYIQEQTGADKSRATREALLAQADRLRRESLRRESAAVRDDPRDRAEALALAEDMAAINAW